MAAKNSAGFNLHRDALQSEAPTLFQHKGLQAVVSQTQPAGGSTVLNTLTDCFRKTPSSRPGPCYPPLHLQL